MKGITAYFPIYYRMKKFLHVIKDPAMKKHLLTYCCLFLFAEALILSYAVYSIRADIATIEAIKQQKQDRLSYWKGASEQYPNEPDILYNAAVAALNTGNKKIANEYLQKALVLDPLFEKAKNLRSEMLKK